MALTCTKINEWVEEEVSKPVEEWEEREQEKCKKRKWYDPRGWFCWIVVVFVKVVRWVIVTVGKWVVRTVCTFVATIVDLVRSVLTGLWDIIAGIFTLDWRRILDGLLGILIGLVTGLIRLARIVYLVDTLDHILDEINRGRLKRYVRGLVEDKYSGDTLDEIKEELRLDHGAFGLRMDATIYRTYLDSETPSEREPEVPNLVILHESGAINLTALCGFEFDEGYWNRKRYKTLKKGLVVGGGGGGEFDNPISEDELDDYLASRGADGPAFIVLPMRDGVLDRHISTAEEKGRELGLMLDFARERAEVTAAGDIVHNGSQTTNTRLLEDLAGRIDRNDNDGGAAMQQCEPVGIAVFRYMNTLRGLASILRTADCGLTGNRVSGVTYVDNQPDEIWKYVLIHEFGHYFGLCHVDGLNRIMYSSSQNSWWRWSMVPSLLFEGEPGFTFGEAKAAWDHIVDHFPPECLGAEPVIIIVD